LSKERARRRAEREQQQEAAATERARRAARQARRQAARTRLTGLVPKPVRTGRPGGLLARRRREQNAIVAVVFVVVQVIAWTQLSSWTERLAVLILSAFLVPVFVVLAFDRRP
jgi:Flp pilus assembly protein TadB